MKLLRMLHKTIMGISAETHLSWIIITSLLCAVAFAIAGNELRTLFNALVAVVAIVGVLLLRGLDEASERRVLHYSRLWRQIVKEHGITGLDKAIDEIGKDKMH